MTFGDRLRDLRKQANLSQRELAAKAEIDFTYLSKIENSMMGPPSEKTIEKIAEALKADSGDLILLAQKVPSDLRAVITTNPDAVQVLRTIRNKRYAEKDMDKILKELDELGKD